ncbi:MAG TPA: hypothetical protein DET40_01380 [Lentisphaeria bacterium]|nr:MAG: hypothetical protein A2X45_09370 [Lentisphaerae bacterium GWF2_50_93]HCE42184.1 hypothetical protein [Lentisphaeria bacterium]
MFKNKITAKSLLRLAILSVIFFLGVYFIPHNWCAREAGTVFRNDGGIQGKMARQAEKMLSDDLGRNNFKTGSDLFNGEWLFGTYMMSGMGFGQMALMHPDRADEYLPHMEECIRKIQDPYVREFDKKSWGDDPIESLDRGSEHAAFLGYYNLLLSFHRLLDNGSEFSKLNDRITEVLAARLDKSPFLLLQSYPSEWYPVDNCAVFASIGLYDRATGSDHSRLLNLCMTKLRNEYTDPRSGLLYQSIDGNNGKMLDAPRGSGTCLGLYFLSFSEPSISRSLYVSAKRELQGGLLGFGGMKEYPASEKGGFGDIDSGPVIFGYGVSPTGFMIAGTRIHDDYGLFRKLYSTAYLCGSPCDSGGRRNFATGGHIGNAIMFVVMTAPSEKILEDFCARRIK